MSYASKYRPVKFEHVVGNESIIAKLRDSLSSGIGCNNILLTGDVGNGKTSLGRIIAMHLLCKGSKADLEASLNYREIDCARHGGIDDIKTLTGSLCYSWLSGHKRVIFLDECAYITINAQRALLKPMEEASDSTYFILATSEPEKLDKALIDRCNRFHLLPPTDHDIFRHLVRIVKNEGLKIGKTGLMELVGSASGKIRQAERKLENYAASGSFETNKQLEAQKAIGNYQEQTDDIQDDALTSCCNIDAEDQCTTKLMVAPRFQAEKAKQYLNAIHSTVHTSEFIINSDIKKPKYFMSPFVHEGALMMIYAEAGVGKTWFSYLLAMALTRSGGQSFTMGPLKVSEQCGVAIIDGELPRYEIQSRFMALAGPMGAENIENPLSILTSDELVEKHGEPINLADENWRNAIYSYMESNPVNRVLVFDNMASLTSGISENSKEAYGPINQWLLSFRRLGLAVIIIHHGNKAGGYRGTSSMIDNLDTVICLDKLNDADDLCFKVKFEKARTAKRGEKKGFIIKSAPHPDNPDWLVWEHFTDDQADEQDALQRLQILANVMLWLKRGSTQEEIGKQCGISQGMVSRYKKEATEKGYLTATKEITDIGMMFIAGLGIQIDGPDEEATA